MSETPTRDRKAQETRSRIADAALELFRSQGYAETTIDQIAAASGVGRRTIFRYFATKEAIIFDHLVVRREEIVRRFRQRPAGEPPIVGLHAVLREHCSHGFDRRLLWQIRAVLESNPGLGGEDLSAGNLDFEWQLIDALQARPEPISLLEAHALTSMACGWMLTSVRMYLLEGRRSLVRTFDEVVDACMKASSLGLG